MNIVMISTMAPINVILLLAVVILIVLAACAAAGVLRVRVRRSANGRLESLTFSFGRESAEPSVNDEVRKCEEKFRIVADNTYDWEYWIGPDGRFLYTSPACLRTTGYEAAAFFDDPSLLKKITVEADRELMERHMAGQAAQQAPEEIEFRITHADGSHRWMQHVCTRVFDDNGVFRGMRASNRDITERKHAEEAFILEQLFNDKLLDSLPGIFYLYTYPDLRLVRWNKNHEKLLGYGPGEIKDRYLFDWHVPEAKPYVLEAVEEVMRAGQSIAESPLRTKDGRSITFHMTGVRFEAHGKKYLMGVGIDMEERIRVEAALRRSEHMLQDAQEVARIGYYVTDLRTGTWESSPVLNDILGVDDTFIFDLKHSEQITAPQYREVVRRHFIDAIKARRRFSLDYQIVRPCDGVIRWVSALGELEFDEAGIPVSMIGTIQDITDRKTLEQQLLQAQKLEGVGTLAGGIAHDFNNLLAMVLGSAELLKHHVREQPELKKYVDRIIDASERGTSISRQLLIFSRPDQAKLKPISLSHTITELQEMLRHFLPKSIDVNTEIDVEHGIIMGDAGQIHQAILNLALNAGDAMTNSGTLTIRESTVSAEFIADRFSVHTSVPHVRISVSDTGVGMEAEVIAKIFDPFFSTKERGKGTGLGLAMVHGIVKNHHGLIDVKSVPGEGAEFSLFFPALMQQAEAPPAVGAVPAQRHDETILIVDDEEHLRDMLTEYLSGSGYRVITATNGAEALEVFTTQFADVDLVITDLGMPQMGGEELYRRLKKINPRVNVMVSSGYLDGTTKEHLLQLGIRDVLTKPSKLQDIHRAIRTVLG